MGTISLRCSLMDPYSSEQDSLESGFIYGKSHRLHSTVSTGVAIAGSVTVASISDVSIVTESTGGLQVIVS